MGPVSFNARGWTWQQKLVFALFRISIDGASLFDSIQYQSVTDRRMDGLSSDISTTTTSTCYATTLVKKTADNKSQAIYRV